MGALSNLALTNNLITTPNTLGSLNIPSGAAHDLIMSGALTGGGGLATSGSALSAYT